MTPDLKLTTEGRFTEAEKLIRDLGDPYSPRTHFALGFHALRRGDLREGLAMRDAGRYAGCWGDGPFPEGAPPWQGQQVPEGSVTLLDLECGFGDQFIGARWIERLAQRGHRVVVSCSPSIGSIVARVPGCSAVIATHAASHVMHHQRVQAMSAPRWLADDWPDLWRGPYLSPDPAHAAKWKRAIDADAEGRLKVGLRWRGRPDHEYEQQRCFDPSPLWEIPKIAGLRCYSFQRDAGAELLPGDADVVDLADGLQTWEDTAAALCQMDLVISSCTSVAHLAAALGVKTWVIVPVMPYYLWLYPPEGDRSPWYGDTVRLFRQERHDDWSGALDRVVEAAQTRSNR